MTSAARNLGIAGVFVLVLCAGRGTAHADIVLDWNAIAIRALSTQPAPGVNPFYQARFMAITQLAVFEAVNAITGEYEPYADSVTAAHGASVEAATVAAVYRVLVTYFPSAATVAALDADPAASLATIPDGPAKQAGIAVGEAAA